MAWGRMYPRRLLAPPSETERLEETDRPETEEDEAVETERSRYGMAERASVGETHGGGEGLREYGSSEGGSAMVKVPG